MGGAIVSIHTTARAGGALASRQQAQLVAGRGIVGDRYFSGEGHFSPAAQDPDHELTLIELEQVAHVNAVAGLALQPGELRRNLVSVGVALNELVGVEFRVGEVVLRGIRLCEPCRHLAALTHEGVLRHLVHRGGLRAAIVRGGVVRIGDAVSSPGRALP
jgi:MOSC domain-containing protein YiiM